MAKKKKKKRGSGKIAVFLALVVIAGALLYRGHHSGTLNVTEAGSSIVSVMEDLFGRLRAGEFFGNLLNREGNLLGTLREKGGDLIATIFRFERPEEPAAEGETYA